MKRVTVKGAPGLLVQGDVNGGPAVLPSTPTIAEDGKVLAWDNAEGEFAWTTGGGGGAPTTADYLVKTADAGLSAERVVTDTSWISVDWGTAGQAKFNLADAGLVSLAGQDGAAGLPFVSGANTWTSLALAADKGIYATGAGALATYDLTSFARTLLDDTTASSARGTLAAAPVASSFLVVGLDAEITNERRLQGTTNRITLTDGGAGADLVLDVGSSVYVAGGTDVAVADGGTGLSSYAAGDLLYASGTTTLSKLAAGTQGDQLRQGASAPAWGGANAWWGPGSDGAVTFDGTTTYAGFASTSGAAPNLVYTLTRDVLATTLSVSSGITVNTGGYQIYTTGTLSGAGTIQMEGPSANVGVQGNGFSDVGSVYVRSASGGAGRAGAGGGNNGTGQIQCIGGAGGNGGASNLGNGGGTGGSVTAPTAAMGNWRDMTTAILRMRTPSSADHAQLRAGCGGGGGGLNGTGTSGGGGAGGGIVLIWARYVTFTGTIRARGGNGGNATASGAGNQAGGGGGGGGGHVRVITTSPTATYTASAAGGVKGTGANGGADGVDGSAGVTDHLVV